MREFPPIGNERVQPVPWWLAFIAAAAVQNEWPSGQIGIGRIAEFTATAPQNRAFWRESAAGGVPEPQANRTVAQNSVRETIVRIEHSNVI